MTMVLAPLSRENSMADKADGTGADDQHVLTRLGLAAIDGVAADGQGFNQRQLFEIQFRRRYAAFAPV